VAPSDATEKIGNIGAQLHSILYTTAQKKIVTGNLPVLFLLSILLSSQKSTFCPLAEKL